MKEYPILFSTPMVRAILEGRKTMTRRVVSKRHHLDHAAQLGEMSWAFFENLPLRNGDEKYIIQFCPYGQVGDVLWVRETWQETTWMSKDDENYGYVYKASENGKAWEENTENWKWKPSIFMPKKACRIKLRITNIRVERLNDISEEDAMNEGVILRGNIIKENNPDFTHKYRFAFCLLWESINGKGSWEKNSWVWVIEFERLVCDPVT